ncbi:MAG TPA: DeoR/GlpR family DNA-binding transcription regulator [Planctomycetota bacterium]
MIAAERRRKLLNALRKSGSLSVSSASDLLRVSRGTVHRDMEALAAAGLLRKIHGGAVPIISMPVIKNSAVSFTERRPVNAPAKEAIARHLVKLLANAHNIALDASTTVFSICSVLKAATQKPVPFILTNGVPLFQELQRLNLGYRIALTGGEPHPRTDSLIGPLAIKSLEGMRFDLAVVSAVGLMEEEGQTYDATAEDCAVKQAFLARATTRVLALDTTKVNFLAPYPSSPLSDFDLLVTENGVRELDRKKH